MKVQMTKQQAILISVNAINASIPMGMGHLHYENKDYNPEDIEPSFNLGNGITFDYFNGRMVKLYIYFEDGIYNFPNSVPRLDYQSWCTKYPTYLDLIKSVIEEPIIEEEIG